jgi:hydrogenase 3 maturation protease
MLGHLKSHLNGKVIILGIGNTLRSDDGAGSVLVSRIKDSVPFLVWDAGVSPENYLNRIIKEKPDNLVIIDTADFGGKAGELRVVEADGIKTSNLFSTHNASLSLLINYLQSHIKTDIIVVIIQPKTIALGEALSPEVSATLNSLRDFFYVQAKQRQ